MIDERDPGPCPYCGTQMENCGPPIGEDYCPNDDCHGHRDEFFASIKRRVKEAEELRVAKETALVTVQRMLAEIDRLRPHYQSNSMLDHGRRQMLDYFAKMLGRNADG